MGLIAARSRSAAWLLAAMALTVLVAATFITAVLAHTQVIPSAVLHSLLGSVSDSERLVSVSVRDRGDAPEQVDQLVGDLAWVVPIGVTRLPTTTTASRLATWELRPELGCLTPGQVPVLREQIAALETRDGMPSGSRVDVPLGGLLDGVQRPVLVARAVAFVPAVATVLVAGMALTLTARLVAGVREDELELLNARGFSSGQLLRVNLGEAVAVAAPGALLARPLAAVAVRLLPAADGGTAACAAVAGAATPTGLGAGGWLIAGCVALAGVVAMVTVLHRGRGLGSASSTRARVLRTGLDLLVVGVAVLGVWQFLRYDGLLSEQDGVVGVDPFAIATPALVLLAGALITLRLMLWTARRLDGVAARSAGVSAPLGVWQVARRPLRQTGPALLLVIAVGVGMLSLILSASWARSTHDRADLAAGADLRVAIGQGQGANPALIAPDAAARLEAVPGVRAAMPVVSMQVSGERLPMRMIAWDAEAAGGIVPLRDDLIQGPPSFAAAGDRLVGARPQTEAIALPDGSTALDVEVALAGGSQGAARVRVSAVVQDAAGLLHRLAPIDISSDAPTAQGPVRTTVPLTPAGTEAAEAGIDGLSLIAWELTLTSGDEDAAGRVSADLTIAARAVTADGAVDLTAPAAWRATSSHTSPPELTRLTVPGDALLDVALSAPSGDTAAVIVRPAAANDPGAGVLTLPEQVPTIAILAGPGVPGQTTAVLARHNVRLEAVGRVSALPGQGTAPGAGSGPGVVVDLPGLLLAIYEVRGEILQPDSWWLATTAEGHASAAAALDAGPLGPVVADRQVMATELESEPLGVTLMGTLALSLAGTVVFAGIGMVVAAVVAVRERRGDLALLRAIGATPTQMRAALAVEQLLLLGVAVVLGGALGVGVAAGLLPRLLLDARGRALVPAVDLTVPWLEPALLVGGAAALVVLVVVAVSRAAMRGVPAQVLRSTGQAGA